MNDYVYAQIWRYTIHLHRCCSCGRWCKAPHDNHTIQRPQASSSFSRRLEGGRSQGTGDMFILRQCAAGKSLQATVDCLDAGSVRGSLFPDCNVGICENQTQTYLLHVTEPMGLQTDALRVRRDTLPLQGCPSSLCSFCWLKHHLLGNSKRLRLASALS